MNKTINFKKNYVLAIVVVSAIFAVGLIFLLSMNPFSKNDYSNRENDELHDHVNAGYILESHPYIMYETSLEENIDKADLIIRAIVSKVGESYLEDGFTLNIGDELEKVKENITGIRTPITLEILEIYKGAERLHNEGTIILNEYYGSYNGFELKRGSAELFLTESAEYILYINEIRGVYYIMAQPSVLLENNISDDNRKSFIENIVTDYLTYDIAVDISNTINERGFVSLLLNDILFENYLSTEDLVNLIKSIQETDTYD